MNYLYEKVIRRALFAMDAERAHHLATTTLKIVGRVGFLRGVASVICRAEESPIRLFGLDFPNRIGLAAGMDKCAEFPSAAAALGFGHIEVGTVTPEAQKGNPQPRLFRYPRENAVVNRMGFNNDGSKVIASRIAKSFPKGKRPIPLGINLGKGRETDIDDAALDYLKSFEALGKHADYVTINVSSPNTQNLRSLQNADRLGPLLQTIRLANKESSDKMGQPEVPILLKVSPDESFRSLDIILELVFRHGVSGIIATNTSLDRSFPSAAQCSEPGGLSGTPLKDKSTEVIRYLSKASEEKIPIIGVGGIMDAESASEKLDVGASLLQIYTGLIYKGPLLVKRLSRSISRGTSSWF